MPKFRVRTKSNNDNSFCRLSRSRVQELLRTAASTWQSQEEHDWGWTVVDSNENVEFLPLCLKSTEFIIYTSYNGGETAEENGGGTYRFSRFVHSYFRLLMMSQLRCVITEVIVWKRKLLPSSRDKSFLFKILEQFLSIGWDLILSLLCTQSYPLWKCLLL